MNAVGVEVAMLIWVKLIVGKIKVIVVDVVMQLVSKGLE